MQQATQQIQVQVNTQNLIQNLAYAFTNKATLLSEIIQNARRAGSAYVSFDLDGDTLTVKDAGCGIDDFQNLLTVADSGWDAETKTEEMPFGMGFLSVLYQTERVTVRSKGKVASFNVQEALSFGMINVEPCADDGLTTIVMEGFSISDEKKLKMNLVKFAEGYEIPVIFNGENLSRKLAINGEFKDVFVQTEIGLIAMPQLELLKNGGEVEGCNNFKTSPVVFLQGLSVKDGRDSYRYFDFSMVNPIIHLDSKRFKARMPDRDVLIDSDEQMNVINGVITNLWKSAVLEAKANLEPSDFLNRWYVVIKHFKWLEILNDFDLIPLEITSLIDSAIPAHCSQEQHGETIECVDIVSRADVESGKTILCFLPDQEGNEQFSHEISSHLMACLSNWVVIEKQYFHKDHWALKHVVNFDLSQEDTDEGDIMGHIHVTAVNTTKEGEYYINWGDIGGRLAICDAIEVVAYRNNVEFARITTDQYPTIDAQGSMLWPATCGYHAGSMVNALCSFIGGNDDYEESDANEAEELLHKVVQSLLVEDSETLLRELLQGQNLSLFAALKNKSFTLSFDDKHKITVVEVK